MQAAVWPADIVRAADRLLHRSAFVAAGGGSADDLRRAALGDADAAVRLAQASRGHDADRGTQRYVGWLQFASLLGQREASYTLALPCQRRAAAGRAVRSAGAGAGLRAGTGARPRP